VVVGGTGFDQITGGNGDKIVLADDGAITWSGGQLQQIVSQDPSVSLNSTDANHISLGDGNNIIFGGSGANTITAGNGNDIVAGANGELDFQNGVPTTFQSTYPSNGGNDKITLGNGHGVVIGGPGNNSITAGSGYALIQQTGKAIYSAAQHSWIVVEPAPAPTRSTPPVTAGPPAVPTTVPTAPISTPPVLKKTGKKHKKAKKPKKGTKPKSKHPKLKGHGHGKSSGRRHRP
jgi:hypothetical protein